MLYYWYICSMHNLKVIVIFVIFGVFFFTVVTTVTTLLFLFFTLFRNPLVMVVVIFERGLLFILLLKIWVSVFFHTFSSLDILVDLIFFTLDHVENLLIGLFDIQEMPTCEFFCLLGGIFLSKVSKEIVLNLVKQEKLFPLGWFNVVYI